MRRNILWHHDIRYPIGLQALKALEEFDSWFDEPIRVPFDPDEQINTLPMQDERKDR